MEAEYQVSRERSHNSEPVARRARIYAKVPLKQMIRRGWIEHTADLDALERGVCRFLCIDSIDQEPQFFHSTKKSTSYAETTQLQMVWLFRARAVAESMVGVPEFSRGKLQAALPGLKVLLRGADGVRHVPATLRHAGIRFVVVEPLAGSGMDGAVFWLDETSPVVALSIRFNRIDNFWFVLMHELGHIFHQHLGSVDHHMEKPIAEDAQSEEELQASQFASEQIIPPQEIARFIARKQPYFSTQSILSFASQLDLHPGLVVGQLQHRDKVGWASFRQMLVPIRESVVAESVADGWGSTVQL